MNMDDVADDYESADWYCPTCKKWVPDMECVGGLGAPILHDACDSAVKSDDE